MVGSQAAWDKVKGRTQSSDQNSSTRRRDLRRLGRLPGLEMGWGSGDSSEVMEWYVILEPVLGHGVLC